MRFLSIVVVVSLGSTAAFSQEAKGLAPDGTSLGDLTKEAIAAGFDQGGHSSGQDEPRVGLANVVEQGNLGATVALKKSLLGD